MSQLDVIACHSSFSGAGIGLRNLLSGEQALRLFQREARPPDVSGVVSLQDERPPLHASDPLLRKLRRLEKAQRPLDRNSSPRPPWRPGPSRFNTLPKVFQDR